MLIVKLGIWINNMKKILGIIVLGLLLSGNANSHSGNTNAGGCHMIMEIEI